jgi:hypothetical protein
MPATSSSVLNSLRKGFLRLSHVYGVIEDSRGELALPMIFHSKIHDRKGESKH